MDKITEALLFRKKELEKAIAVAEACLKDAPEGRLRISSSHGVDQYYLTQTTNGPHKHSLYLPKSNEKLIFDLAQKDYAIVFLRTAKSELKAIDNLLKKNILYSSNNMYVHLP
ncbi:MAG: hypothetical protein J5750_03535, partial [Clostridiales bacterium]|nr:hypothetical protein [Clostridiales bacterium]